MDVVKYAFVAILFIQLSEARLDNRYGVLVAVRNQSEQSFCIQYYNKISTLPTSRELAIPYPLTNFLNNTWSACDSNSSLPLNIFGSVLLMNQNSNCSILETVEVVKDLNGKGLIVVVKQSIAKQFANASALDITLTFIDDVSAKEITVIGNDVHVIQFAPKVASHIDYSLIVIAAIAIFTVTLGSYWSGVIRYNLIKQKKAGRREDFASGTGTGAAKEEDSLHVTPVLVIILVFCMCGMLLLLYFFYNYLVYVIIALFCMASAMGLYQCLDPFIICLPGNCARPIKVKLCSSSCQVSLKQVILALICISVSVSWFIVRKESYAWIIQDILGVAFSINMLKVIRLPNLKICSVLMVLLFFYDIFFVFVTPFFTKSGESIMVEVATGGSSNEQLPMVIKVPHMVFDPLSVCHSQYSLLGFGDILIPGMLISYCHSFDLEIRSHKIYFISTIFAYACGLLLTFVGLYVMTSAQPALLYLVPCTLLTVILISCCRKEFKHIWNGTSSKMKAGDESVETRAEGEEEQGERNEQQREAGNNSDSASEIGEDTSLMR